MPAVVCMARRREPMHPPALTLSTILLLLLAGGVLVYALLYACLWIEERTMRWLSRGPGHATRPQPDTVAGDLRDIVTEDGSVDVSTRAGARESP